MNLPSVGPSQQGRPSAEQGHVSAKEASSRVSLADSAHTVLTATLPGEHMVRRSALGTMLAASPELLAGMTPGERLVVGAAMIRARVYQGATVDLLDLAEHEAESLTRDLDGGLSQRLRSLCHAALSEGYLAMGFAKRANIQARIAEGYAHEADDDACLYRATALTACSLALNGEFTRADEASLRGRSLEALHEWPMNTSALPLLLADMAIGYARLDAELLESVLERISTQAQPGPIYLAYEQLASGWLHMLRGQYDQALTRATALTAGSDFHSIPKLITGFALGLQAMADVHRGEPGRALTLLEGVPSLGDHMLCYDLQRSTALLQLGEARRALVVTDNCIRMGATHNLRTLPSVLLRRAVANLRLGHQDAAYRAFVEAFNIMRSAGAFTPLLGLGADELDVLLDDLVEQQPDHAEAVAEFRSISGARPHGTTQFATVKLTPRESLVAEWLRSDLPFNEIAAKLFVSKNTLKTQTRSIYRKLDVSSREEAVRRLASLGVGVHQP